MFKLLEILYHIKQNYDFDFSLILSIKSFLLESNIKTLSYTIDSPNLSG